MDKDDFILIAATTLSEVTLKRLTSESRSGAVADAKSDPIKPDGGRPKLDGKAAMARAASASSLKPAAEARHHEEDLEL